LKKLLFFGWVILTLLGLLASPLQALSFQKSTGEHLNLYYTEDDKPNIPDVMNMLRDYYGSITQDLQMNTLPAINVYLYPDWESFHQDYPQGDKNTLAWGINSNSFAMVSPEGDTTNGQWNYIDRMRAGVHELCHCLMQNISDFRPSTCFWLYEAMAMYESDQLRDPKGFIYLKKGDYPHFTAMTSESEENTKVVDENGYTIIEYIYGIYTRDGLLKLIKYNGNVQSGLGVSPEKLEKDWYGYVKEKYIQYAPYQDDELPSVIK